MAISVLLRARPVRIEATPIPIKKIAIMPERLQRSPSQPAGMAPTAKATKPGVASNSSSLYDPSNCPCNVSTTVGKSSMNKWS